MASQVETGWHRINRAALAEVWPFVSPLLQEAIDRDPVLRESLEDVRAELEAETRSLWIGWRDGLEAVMVIRILEFPKVRTAWITHGAGNNLKFWLGPAFDVVFQYLREYDCRLLELAGRKGFARAAPRTWKRGAYLRLEL